MMTRVRIVLGGIIGAGALLCATKCQLFFADYTLPLSDATTDASSDAFDRCTTVGYPDPPATGDPGGDNDWSFALSTIDYGLDGSVPPLNLDQTCTCPGPVTCASNDPACDDKNGGDNGALAVLTLLESSIRKQKDLNALLKNGVSGALIRVQGYNGTKNDTSVVVGIYPAVGLATDGGTKNDGTDRWWIERSSVKDDNPTFPAAQSTNKAWVVDGTLVAQFQNALVVVGGETKDGDVQPPIRISLAQTIITATIDDKKLTKGRLAGRWPIDVGVAGNPSLLKSIEAFPDPITQTGYLCGDSGIFAYLRDKVCKARDISSVVNVGGSCDAMSSVIGFTASRAEIEGLKDGVDAGQPCGASWDPKCP